MSGSMSQLTAWRADVSLRLQWPDSFINSRSFMINNVAQVQSDLLGMHVEVSSGFSRLILHARASSGFDFLALLGIQVAITRLLAGY